MADDRRGGYGAGAGWLIGVLVVIAILIAWAWAWSGGERTAEVTQGPTRIATPQSPEGGNANINTGQNAQNGQNGSAGIGSNLAQNGSTAANKAPPIAVPQPNNSVNTQGNYGTGK